MYVFIYLCKTISRLVDDNAPQNSDSASYVSGALFFLHWSLLMVMIVGESLWREPEVQGRDVHFGKGTDAEGGLVMFWKVSIELLVSISKK
jgi:hypothetical protein